MNIEVISSQPLAGSPKPKCKACDDPPYIEFNWQYAQNGKDKKLLFLAGQLKQVKNLKFGSLYACHLCGLNWVLDDARSTMTRVPDDRRDILNEWSGNQLLIKQEHLEVLETVGGTAQKHWVSHDEAITIPCAISLQSGERIDPALLWITRRPPVDAFTRRVRLYRNIGNIEPSRFALPIDVRRATVSACEVSMGFSPTRVLAENGKPYVLHWATSLFNQDGITGSQIRLSAKPFRMNESVPVAEADFTHATYFLADWFEGAEKLDKTQQGNNLASRLRGFLKRL